MQIRRLPLRTAVLACLLMLVSAAVTSPPSAAGTSPSGEAPNSAAWSRPELVDPPSGGFTDISCVSSTFCRATGSHGTVWAWDGRTWRPGHSFGADEVLSAVSCTSTRFCVVAIGHAPNSTARTGLGMFNGATWRYVAGIGMLEGGLSCASSTFCVEISDSASPWVYRIWNGTSWTSARHTGVSSYYVTDLSCYARNACRGVDQLGVVVRWDGTRWYRNRIDNRLTGISCADASFCVAVDATGRELTYRGAAWSAPRPVASSGLASVACPSVRLCVALTVDGRSTSYHASTGTWTTPVTVSAGADFVGVDCPSTSACFAVSVQGATVRRPAGGWETPAMTNPAAGNPTDVFCASATDCVLVDQAGSARLFNGTSWGGPVRVATDTASLTTVSCPASAFCLAMDSVGRTYVRSAGRWHSGSTAFDPTVYFENTATKVSCSSARFCLATLRYGEADAPQELIAMYDGTTWTTRAASEPAGGAVSCARTYCLISAGSRVLAYDHGSYSFTSDFSTDPNARMISLSCVAPQRCVGLYGLGSGTGATYPVSWDGTAWTPMHSPQAFTPSRVSCASTTFCAAVSNTESTWDGSTWTTPQPLFAGQPPFAGSPVSCVSTTCVAASFTGFAATARRA